MNTIRKLALGLIGSLAVACLAFGQQAPGTYTNPVGAQLSASDSGACTVANSCVWQHLPNNAGTTTINLAGTFSATMLVEESNNGGGTWTTAGTLSSAGTTAYSTNGFTDIRVRCSAFTSGTVQVSLSTGLLQVQSVVSGSSSSSNLPSTAGVIASPSCPASGAANCFQLPASGGMAWGCTWTTVSLSVTCTDINTTLEPVIGMQVFGTNVCATGGLCETTSAVQVPLQSIVGVSGTTVTLGTLPTVNCTASLPGTTCLLVWGNNADTQFTNAWSLATKTCTNVNIASGVWFLTQPNFNNVASSCQNGTGEAKTSVGVTGQGTNATWLIISPAFTANLSSCTYGYYNGTACFFTFPGIQLRDFNLFGGGNSLNSTSHSNIIVELDAPANVTTGIQNVVLGGYGGGVTNMTGFMANTSVSPFVGVQVNGLGGINCQAGGATGAPMSPAGYISISAFNFYCTDGIQRNLIVNAGNDGSTFNSFGGGFGETSNASSVLVSTGAIFISHGDQFNFGYASFPSDSGVEIAGTMFASGNQFFQDTEESATTTCNVVMDAGGKFVGERNVFEGGRASTGCDIYFNGAGAVFNDLGSTYIQSGSNVYFEGGAGYAWNITCTGNCVKGTATGTCTASSTLGMYGTGPNATTSTCTSTTIGSGVQVIGIGRVLQALTVTAGTGGVAGDAVKVLQNGSVVGTCTIGTGTVCGVSLNVALNDGDLITLEVVTGVSTTLANVKATALWN